MKQLLIIELSLITLLASFLQGVRCAPADSNKVVEWELAAMLESPSPTMTIIGNPKVINCSYGKAVRFDGTKDAFEFASNPLLSLHSFTIEVIMLPDSDGEREQRFIHFGEVSGDRVMVETRLTADHHWYLDTYRKSDQIGLTLADSTCLHPLQRWYHVALIVDDGKMESFVNGRRELQGKSHFIPFTNGQTSIGVRLNRINWYKGTIYKIRITPRRIDPNAFMKD